jgi:hypothetical protein
MILICRSIVPSGAFNPSATGLVVCVYMNSVNLRPRQFASGTPIRGRQEMSMLAVSFTALANQARGICRLCG